MQTLGWNIGQIKMTPRSGVLIFVALLGWALSGAMLSIPFLAASAAHAEIVTASDVKAAQAVLNAIDRNRFKDALSLTSRVKNPDVVRVLMWSYISASRSPATFNDVKVFLDHHADWPQRKTFLNRAEETMPASAASHDVLAWFEVMGGPVSTAGRILEAEALLAQKETERAKGLLRKIWIEATFNKAQEDAFYRRHGKYLTKADHVARLDRLLWDEHHASARRQLWKVDEVTRSVATARLWLMKSEGNVDKALADLEKKAPQLLNDPGLVYERLRWRRRKGRMADAAQLFDSVQGDPGRPNKWWVERQVLARNLLQDSKGKEAYAITSRHSLTPNDAEAYSEAEWISGWIALRYLKDPARALEHFKHMHSVVNFPISVARGAYWAGRAAEALGNGTEARTWMENAAKHSTTYYGQLARAKLGMADVVHPDLAPPKPRADMQKAFDAHPMKRAAQILAELGEKDRMRPFLQHLSDINPAPAWQSLSAAFAANHGRPDMAIRLSKQSEREGAPLGALGYPAITLPIPAKHKNGGGVEAPLVLAVIRQESEFYVRATSHVGARGLMQVMPATAKNVAKENRLPYDRDRLTGDPSYNLIIGQMYLSGVIEEFDGSYPMAIAAYNAGPGRVKSWLRTYGDPRKGEIDIIDWVELIPFSETRNYVQRVLENLSVYRARLKSKHVAQGDG